MKEKLKVITEFKQLTDLLPKGSLKALGINICIEGGVYYLSFQDKELNTYCALRNRINKEDSTRRTRRTFLIHDELRVVFGDLYALFRSIKRPKDGTPRIKIGHGALKHLKPLRSCEVIGMQFNVNSSTIRFSHKFSEAVKSIRSGSPEISAMGDKAIYAAAMRLCKGKPVVPGVTPPITLHEVTSTEAPPEGVLSTPDGLQNPEPEPEDTKWDVGTAMRYALMGMANFGEIQRGHADKNKAIDEGILFLVNLKMELNKGGKNEKK